MTFPFKSIMNKKEQMEGSPDDIMRSVLLSNNTGETAASYPIVVPLGAKKRYMIIDETKLSKEEAERVLVKRAYNRECAERARKRSKETINEYERQIKELHADKVELRSKVAAMAKELQMLKEENSALSVAVLTPRTAGISYSPLNIEEALLSVNLYPRLPQQSLFASWCSGDVNNQSPGSLLPSDSGNGLMLS